MISLALKNDQKWSHIMPAEFTPSKIDIYRKTTKTRGKYISTVKTNLGKQNPIAIIQHHTDYTIVVKQKEVNVCDDCHIRYVSKHHCNVRTIKFLDSVIDRNNYMYKNIKFFPATSPENAKTLWIIYDMETFTKHTKAGKQLKPFLIAFTIVANDETLYQEVLTEIAVKHKNYKLNNIEETYVYYELNVNSNNLCKNFNSLRKNIAELVLNKCWRNFTHDNPTLQPNIDAEKLKKSKKELNINAFPQYYEVVIMGHNISAFDEILSWSHMLDWATLKKEYPQFKWKRLFLPRAGKMLFNDTYATIPNPSFTKPSKTTFERWSKGEIDSKQDLKNQGVFFRVRDTYLLTHTSLRNAAKAYGLNVQKGSCPYAAVNEYLMTGKYKCDMNMYPDIKYWNNQSEYLENKPQEGEKYDIIHQTILYCLKDVIVNRQLAITLRDAYQTFFNQSIGSGRFDVFKRPTVSSNTHALFKQVAYRNQTSHNSDVFTDIIAPSGEGYEHVRDSIRGGRCYPSYLGIFCKPIYIYDICGMYASALTHPMPSGKLCNRLQSAFYISKIQHKLSSRCKINYFDQDIKPIIAYADCYPPTIEKLDVLPPMGSKKHGQLIWTNEAITGEVMTTIDLITMNNRGWECKILIDKPYMVWPTWKCICADYVKINIEAKEKASKEGNETLRSLSKLLSNALYGSFATRLDTKKIILGPDLEDENIGEDITNRITTVLIPDHLTCMELDLSDTIISNLPENHPTGDTEKITTLQNGGRNIIKVADHDDEMLTIYTADKGSSVDNDRYASHIASYVLAWTRAFISEWADFIYREDRGTPIEKRQIASVYGDTDSLFLTDIGRERLIRNGSHRIKTESTKLIFDPSKPDLTWAVECETKCSICNEDAYSEESIFLAPKLYALKNLKCKNSHISDGKIRAKGHNKSSIDYDTLKKCFMWTHMKTEPPTDKDQYSTERLTIKKTLIHGNSRNMPMTIKESTLIRVLQPWKNKRLRDIYQMEEIYSNEYGVGQILVPFDSSSPYQSSSQTDITMDWPEPSTSYLPQSSGPIL